MWRIVQTLPRVVRLQWNHPRPTPQPICGQDEEQQSKLSVAIQPTSFIHTHHGERKEDGHQETGPDREWCRHHVNKPCLAFEAFGWSTALVLGIQLSHLWHFHNKKNVERTLDPTTRHKLCQLYRLAIYMPICGGLPALQTVKQIFPSYVDRSTAKAIADKEKQPPLSDLRKQPEKLQCCENLASAFEDENIESLFCGNRSTNLQNGRFGFKSLVDDLIFPNTDDLKPHNSQQCEASQDAESTSLSTEQEVAPIDQLTQTDDETKDEIESAADIPLHTLPEFTTEWEKLCLTYRGIQGNEEGLDLARSGDFQAAFEQWKAAADETGYAKANFNTGLCFEIGKGVEKDIKKAISYYEKAASDGHSKACYNLAVLYLRGYASTLGQELLLQAAAGKDDKEHIKQLRNRLIVHQQNCIEQEQDMQNGDSTFFLGFCYEHGLGVSLNSHKAADLYKSASDLGHRLAHASLAECYEQGRGGIPIDIKMAIHYYQLAGDGGDEEAMHKALVLNRRQQTQEALGNMFYNILEMKEEIQKDALHTSASTPSLGQYIQRHLLESNFSNWADGFNVGLDTAYVKNVHEQMNSRNDSIKAFKPGIPPRSSMLNRQQRSSRIQKGISSKFEHFEDNVLIGNNSIRKSHSTSSLAKLKIKLLLGESISLQNVTDNGNGTDMMMNVDNNSVPKTDVKFDIFDCEGDTNQVPSGNSALISTDSSQLIDGLFAARPNGSFGDMPIRQK